MCIMSVIVAFRGFICPCFFADVYLYCLRGESGKNGHFWALCGHFPHSCRGVYREGGSFGGSIHRQPQIWIQKNFFKKIIKILI